MLPRVLVGMAPQDAAFDPATRTVYVANQNDNTISVVDARRCNARDTSGCGQAAPAFAAGSGPFSIGIDDATHTVYVADSHTDTVSVFNAGTCNAADTTGCGTPATAKVGDGPAGIAVDPATDTVYVTNSGPGMDGSGHTVSVINGATCNAGNTSGCSQTPATVHVGHFAFGAAFDAGTPGTVSVIDGATCNAAVTTGCGQPPPTVTVGNGNVVAGLAVDQPTDTIYAVNTIDNTVSVINGATCNRRITSGCSDKPAAVHVGRQGFGFAAADPAADLIYVTNYLDDTVSVINGATCNGNIASGCDQTPPTVPAGGNPAGLVLDQAGHTVYVADNGLGPVSFFSFQIPGRPAGVIASTRQGQALLAWQPPPHGGLPVIYQVIPSPACPACHGLKTPPTSGEPFTTISGLTPGLTYTFEIKATDAAGTGPASAPSNPITP
jgi:DNA-binding beta-propeller fold protein YncE